MKTFVLAFALFGLCSTSPIRWGQCSEPTLPPFTFGSFLGAGFVARRTKRVPWDKKQCIKVEVKATTPASTIRRDLKVSQKDLNTGKLTGTGGQLVFDDPTKGQGKVTGSAWIPSGDFRVIQFGPSPVGHSIIYSCVPYLFFFKKEYMWIIVGNQADAGTAANPLLVTALSVIKTFTADDFVTIDQNASLCTYIA